MNIEQYRALKAQEAQQQDVEQPVVEPTSTEDVTDVKPEETKQEASIPEVVEIDGKEVTIEELKSGYLRQSDYTKKTQEVSKQRKEAEKALELYNKLQTNPDAIEHLQTTIDLPDDIDPASQRINDLEGKLYEMMLEKEISDLQHKYDDFEVMEVLNVADAKGITNLEDAYFIAKASKQVSKSHENKPSEVVDVNSLREQIKQELLQELKNENVSTRTIISPSSNNAPIKPKEVQVSSSEAKVAQMMGMTPKEYATWRDAGNK